ncbi:MAG: thiamine-monophosphate kinase [Candidatus Hodarchaeota archaeon]
MSHKKYIRDLGELKIIKIIDNLIFKKTGKELIQDDSFFFSLNKRDFQNNLILNSDMFVSTTDAPKQMTFRQIGRKSVLMNISDLMVKGVRPRGIIISLGIPNNLSTNLFEELMNGIIDYCKKWNLDYIGGDINETKELIINPTVFGFKDPSMIIFRSGIHIGDNLVVNNKFGLNGVGFDILVRKKGNLKKYPKYKRSILSVLEPEDPGEEAYILANNRLATSSIDSSDGLVKSLKDLMIANPHIGFEIDFDDNLFHKEALLYSLEYNFPLEKLIFEGGEEFIQIFTISSNNVETAQIKAKERGGQLFKIGKVISEEKVYFKKNNTKLEIKSQGFKHFK